MSKTIFCEWDHQYLTTQTHGIDLCDNGHWMNTLDPAYPWMWICDSHMVVARPKRSEEGSRLFSDEAIVALKKIEGVKVVDTHSPEKMHETLEQFFGKD